ncbi:MAG TPA: VIT domain-containing protein [Candidatus Polarisedimenticolia bacterium]|nr:VIT domain-containing protein [Candidatus Polarisedimenticolia bacterium]
MGPMGRRGAFLLGLLLIVTGPILAQAREDESLSPYFLVEQGDDAAGEGFPLKSTNVTVRISGVIADVLVVQTYRNEGTLPIHARYVFPGSTRASVHGMRIKVGDQMVVAKIKERQQAKREFEQAKAGGKSASLLEQQRPNLFTMSVANILPADQVEVELHYTELLVPEDGVYQFVYPTVAAPRYSHSSQAASPEEDDECPEDSYLPEGEEPPMTFDIKVALSTGLPLRDLRSGSHPIQVDWHGQSQADVSLAGAEFGGNRDFILDYRLAGKEIESGLLMTEGEENFFLLMVEPPERIRIDEIPPREYVFILDVSGSMHGFPLDTAKSVIRDLIGHLRPTDRFNVILFSGGSRVMAPASLPATEESARQAIQMIDREDGGGGTELAQAVATALALPREEKFSRTVVVITDGCISEEKEVFQMIEKNLNQTNFFSFGIGSGVNRYLVEGLARAGMGEPFVVTQPAEAAEAASRFREYIESPLLTNVQVSFRGFDAYDVEPRALPVLFAQRPIILFGKWRGNRAGEIEVTGEGAARRYQRIFRVSDTAGQPANQALRYLWARARVARLHDFNFGEESDDVVKEITALGLSYSLATPYTSFIAVLEKVRNPGGNAKEVDQPSPLPLGMSDGGYGVGPEPELWVILAAAGLLLAALASRGRRARRAARLAP